MATIESDRRLGAAARSAHAEVLAVWLLLAVVGLEILVTYSRLPVGELYHVSNDGLLGGLSRVVVFANFPIAVAAIAILALIFDRLASRMLRIGALCSAVCCAVVVWPGVVTESDLDVRWVNALPALGVASALLFTLVSLRTHAAPRRTASMTADRARLAIALAVLALGLPWLGAEVGISFESVPVLGTLYQTGEPRSTPRDPALHPAVHYGHHHGMDGVLLVLTALLLSRALPSLQRRGLRSALSFYLSLMFCYGSGNIANDFWIEQVVKRGWTDWVMPDVVVPRATVAWGLIVVAATAVWLLSQRRERFAGVARPELP